MRMGLDAASSRLLNNVPAAAAAPILIASRLFIGYPGVPQKRTTKENEREVHRVFDEAST
jgi:hypothetical protein